MLYYQESGIEIYCGKCQDVMPTLSAVSAVISDPPYGVKLADWDDRPPKQRDLNMCLKLAPVVLWFGAAVPRCMRYVLSLNPPCDRVFIWHNPFTLISTDGAFWSYQPIFVWGKVQDLERDVIIESTNSDYMMGHPAQKPENLMRRLIKAAVPDGGTILDPWTGSGTTLRAAKDLGYKAIGIDISEEYCEIAVRRLSQEVLAF